MTETVTLDAMLFHVDQIAADYELDPAIHELIAEIITGLGKIYGPQIPKVEALRLISHQIEVTKTGYIRDPVEIEEFVTSPDFMNQGRYVRPKIMDKLNELFAPGQYYLEVVLGGAIGIGKNYFSDLALSYILYNISCLYSPQAHYRLAPGSAIVFIHQSKTLQLAKKVVFAQFAGRLNQSKYFPRFFSPNPRYKAELQFPNNVTVLPVSGSDTAALGMNVFGAVIDELNFMQRLTRTKATRFTGEEEYDQAEKLYATVMRRMESRFLKYGKVPGKIFLISSANYKGDFIDRKEEEAKDNPNIFLMHLSQWQALPVDTYLGPKFWIQLPGEKTKGVIYEEQPEQFGKNPDFLEIPIEYLNDFKRDFLASLRDIGGIPTERQNKFIDDNFVESAFHLYKAIYGDNQIFKQESMTFEGVEHLESVLNINFLRRLSVLGPFTCHLDLALNRDSAGIAFGHVVGSKDIGTRTVFNKETGKLTQESQGELPIYGIPGVLRYEPATGEEIDLNLLRELVILINNYINVSWVTTDRFQYASVMQFFRRHKIRASILSLDRNPNGYMEAKFAMREGRVFVVRHTVLKEEFKFLEQDFTSGKIDHPGGGSKDCSDAVAGAIYNLSQKRSTYRAHGEPKVLSPLIPVPLSGDGLRSKRRYRSGRARIY